MVVTFYGRLAEIFGCEREVGEVATLGALRAALGAIDPAILRPGVRGAVDDAFLPDDTPIGPGQRIEFLSPLSGG